MYTLPTVRGCGIRKTAGTYLCCGQSAFGQSIESFIIDPAIVWPYEWIRGFKIVDSKKGYNNVLIFVGKQFYKSPWDFVEEARRFGVSRHVRHDFPFEKLTPGKSRMIFIHKNAIPKFSYCEISGYAENNCNISGSYQGWHDLEQKPCTFALKDLTWFLHLYVEGNENGEFTIKMPSFEYAGLIPQFNELSNPIEWQAGAFLSLAITHIEFPFQANKQAEQSANKAGYETVVLEY